VAVHPMAPTLETRSVSKGVWHRLNKQHPSLTLRVTFLKQVPVAVHQRVAHAAGGRHAVPLERKAGLCDLPKNDFIPPLIERQSLDMPTHRASRQLGGERRCHAMRFEKS